MRKTRCALAAGALLASCSGADNGTGIPAASLQFTTTPIAFGQIVFIFPLGILEVPGHITPSDHIYLYFADPDRCPCDIVTRRPVFAVADGEVTDVQRGVDDKITINAAVHVDYYYGHVTVRSGLGRGSRVKAGEQIGTTSGLAYGVDLGVINYELTQGLLAPGRYAPESLHADKPLRFFPEPLHSQLLALVRRAGADKDGQVSYDRAGTLAGNWFLQGVPVERTASIGADGWPKQLAFVYDPILPSEVRVSIGGTIDVAGIYGIPASDPVPESVTPASGAVVLHLQRPGTNPFPYGRLLVQMIDGSSVRVEKFPVGTGAVAFDGSARLYVR